MANCSSQHHWPEGSSLWTLRDTYLGNFQQLTFVRKYQELPQKGVSFSQWLLSSVHANSNTPNRNTDPPNRAELIVRTPGESKEFKNIQILSLHHREQGLKCHSCLHSLPTKFMPHPPRWGPLHTQPLQRALSLSLETETHHQTGVFSSFFATKLRLTWK